MQCSDLCCAQGAPLQPFSVWQDKKLFTLLDLCVSSLRRGHANLLCIVPILTDDPRRESKQQTAHRKKANQTQTSAHTQRCGWACFCFEPPPKADSTLRSSQAVPHPSTNRALSRLTSEVERDPVHSTWYGRQRIQMFSNICNLTLWFLPCFQTEDIRGRCYDKSPC